MIRSQILMKSYNKYHSDHKKNIVDEPKKQSSKKR